VFLFTIIALAAALSAVMVPVFFGHGLSAGRPGAMLIALGWLGLSAIFFAILKRMPRRPPAGGPHAGH
jgi:hypothetical protein